jgi:hypothetical protein
VQLQALNQVVFNEGEWRRFTEQYLDNPSDTISIKPVRFMITFVILPSMMDDWKTSI